MGHPAARQGSVRPKTGTRPDESCRGVVRIPDRDVETCENPSYRVSGEYKSNGCHVTEPRSEVLRLGRDPLRWEMWVLLPFSPARVSVEEETFVFETQWGYEAKKLEMGT